MEMRQGLVVDDDLAYIQVLQRSFEQRGYKIQSASSVADALQQVAAWPPDFALIELRLGKESGLSLLQPLRSISSDMRILLVTGYASSATVADAIERGADGCLLKPVTVDTIVSELTGGTFQIERDMPQKRTFSMFR